MAVVEKQQFLGHLDQFDKAHRAAPFAKLRQAARERFRDLSFPTAKTEDWRFTSVTPLLKTPFEPAGLSEADGKFLPPLPAPGTLRLVFVNGVYAPALASQGEVPPGIEWGSLAAVRDDQTRRLQKALGLADYQGQIFTALNTSLFYEGAFVIVPDGLSLGTPIEIIYLAAPRGQRTVTYPRTAIVVGKQSQATVIERYLESPEAGVYFTNAVTEVALAAEAGIDHYKVQAESRQAFHIANTQVTLDRGSRFATHFLSLGGGLVRNEVRVRFDGEGAEATVNGLYLAGGKQHIDNYTVIDHAVPNCQSHELYKGILNDQSQGVFNGKIYVRQDAQKTDAKQTNKVLLLSENATINTKPQLEIFADDVKCTHGATVGQLDSESLFYLRTRGIGLEAARALLTYAFANDVIRRIKVDSLRDSLEQWVLKSEIGSRKSEVRDQKSEVGSQKSADF
jgi:Fe-S cluster assembly protein SufD